MKKKVKDKVNWPVTILLIIGLITVAFPLYMTIVIAFKQPSEMTNSIAGILSLPKHWSLSNFAEAMRVTDFWHSLLNSIIITVITVVLSIVLHSMIGYAVGRNKAKKERLQPGLPVHCQRYVCTLRNPDDAPCKTDSSDGNCKRGWRYHLLCGILHADECALILRLSEKYSDGTGRGCTCRRGNNLENLLERYFPNHETDACNSSGTYSTWYME